MIDKSDAQKAREVQDRPVYRRNCSICVRSFYDSLVGPCPERDGRQVCMYCCRMCEHHYTLPGQIGQRCRVKDAARKSAGAKKKDSLPQSPAATAPSRREPGTGDAPAAAGGRNDGKGDAA